MHSFPIPARQPHTTWWQCWKRVLCVFGPQMTTQKWAEVLVAWPVIISDVWSHPRTSSGNGAKFLLLKQCWSAIRFGVHSIKGMKSRICRRNAFSNWKTDAIGGVVYTQSTFSWRVHCVCVFFRWMHTNVCLYISKRSNVQPLQGRKEEESNRKPTLVGNGQLPVCVAHAGRSSKIETSSASLALTG